MGHYTDSDSDAVEKGEQGREIQSFPKAIDTSKRNTSKRNESEEEYCMYMYVRVEYMMTIEHSSSKTMPLQHTPADKLKHRVCEGTAILEGLEKRRKSVRAPNVGRSRETGGQQKNSDRLADVHLRRDQERSYMFELW